MSHLNRIQKMHHFGVFKLTVEPVVKSFKPDIILSVNGVDIHYRDPLTHLNCTLHSLYEIPYFVKYLAILIRMER